MGISSLFNVKNKVSSQTSQTSAIVINEQLRHEIQAALLDMYRDVEQVCKKHGIRLFLCGGSALGAVRHKGFIPWDEDIDTAMTRDDYEKFKSIFDFELSEKYILVAPDIGKGSRSRFPKVMKKNTVFRELGNKEPKNRCGLFVDIFIIENTPNNPLLRKMKGSICDLLMFVGGQVLLVEENDPDVKLSFRKAGRMQYAVRMVVGRLFSYRKSASWNRKIDRVIQSNETMSSYCSLPTGRGHYFGELLPREVFFPGTEGRFEGEKVLLFQDVDCYLRNLYGDYMKIPKKENREAHFVSEIWLGE